MPLCASTGPVLGRCCQHRTSTGPVLVTSGMFTGKSLGLLVQEMLCHEMLVHEMPWQLHCQQV